jgi:hypothetical protein
MKLPDASDGLVPSVVETTPAVGVVTVPEWVNEPSPLIGAVVDEIF